MLLHISNRRSFWICGHCRLEMPDTDKVFNSHKKSTTTFKSPVFKTVVSARAISNQVATI